MQLLEQNYNYIQTKKHNLTRQRHHNIFIFVAFLKFFLITFDNVK